MPPALEARSLNHWTAREVPMLWLVSHDDGHNEMSSSKILFLLLILWEYQHLEQNQ